MTSIFSEISRLRKGAPLVLDYQNSNRYRIVSFEPNGSKTAYYFTTPIYNIHTKKIVDMKFSTHGDSICATGSNARIHIKENVNLENSEGYCRISLSKRCTFISDGELECGNERIYPTTNGIAIRSFCLNENPYTFTVEVYKPFMEIRANDKCFALMSEKFRPFVTISCIGTEDEFGNIIAPAKISYQKLSNCQFTITIIPCSTLGKSVLIEMNLYEPKLFQDTTVESKNPKTNNAFGSIAFLGTTNDFGEQWLYSRPDFSKIHELRDKKILHATLYLPKINNNPTQLSAHKVSSRFCSFGSTWLNKIDESVLLSDSQITDHYINLDLTTLFSDKYGRLFTSDGFILRTQKKDSRFSVIATADNYLAPQILEINYK